MLATLTSNRSVLVKLAAVCETLAISHKCTDYNNLFLRNPHYQAVKWNATWGFWNLFSDTWKRCFLHVYPLTSHILQNSVQDMFPIVFKKDWKQHWNLMTSKKFHVNHVHHATYTWRIILVGDTYRTIRNCVEEIDGANFYHCKAWQCAILQRNDLAIYLLRWGRGRVLFTSIDLIGACAWGVGMLGVCQWGGVTPRKINGWNLKINHPIEKGASSSKPPLLGFMWDIPGFYNQPISQWFSKKFENRYMVRPLSRGNDERIKFLGPFFSTFLDDSHSMGLVQIPTFIIYPKDPPFMYL